MGYKKAGSTSRNGRDSNPKFLGLKKGNGQWVDAGVILIRQKGTKIHADKYVGRGKDNTLFSILPGILKIETRFITGTKTERVYMSINPEPHVEKRYLAAKIVTREKRLLKRNNAVKKAKEPRLLPDVIPPHWTPRYIYTKYPPKPIAKQEEKKEKKQKKEKKEKKKERKKL